jgi:hypothetical protein
MRIATAAAAAVLVAFAGLGLPPRMSVAAACEWEPLTAGNLVDAIDDAEVIAIGTLAEGEGDTLLMTVEEGLKGDALPGDHFLVNNATNLGCPEAHEPGRRNYGRGARVLAFLVADTFEVANFKVAGYGHYIFRIDVDGETLLNHVDRPGEDAGLPPLDDVREAIATAPGSPPVRPDEALDPVKVANPGSGVRLWAAVAAMVLVGIAALASTAAIVVRRRAKPGTGSV